MAGHMAISVEMVNFSLTQFAGYGMPARTTADRTCAVPMSASAHIPSAGVYAVDPTAFMVNIVDSRALALGLCPDTGRGGGTSRHRGMMRYFGFMGCSLAAALAGALLTNVAAAQDAATPTAVAERNGTFDEIQALIDDLQARIDRMGAAAANTDEALDFLGQQIDETLDRGTERVEENAALRDRTSGLNTQLSDVTTSQQALSDELTRLEKERDVAVAELESRIAELANQLALERDTAQARQLEFDSLTSELQSTIGERQALAGQLSTLRDGQLVDKERIIAQLSTIESLRRDIRALRTVRDEFEGQVKSLAAALDITKADLEVAAVQRSSLEQTLTAERARVAELDTSSDALRVRARALEEALATEHARVSELDTTSTSLRDRTSVLEEALATERARLAEFDKSTGAMRDRTRALEARLADGSERTALAQRALEEREIRLAELTQRLASADKTLVAAQERAADSLGAMEQNETRLVSLNGQLSAAQQAIDAEKQVSAAAQDQVSRLTRQLEQLSRQIATLNGVLDATEVKNEEQQVQIVELGNRLNSALATKVQELARYRSEFFGRLREVLGDRSDVQIVGDRFVFQSEVLFPTASAELEPGGQDQLRSLATTLREISGEIPSDVDWVLRIDGHTDLRPISTPDFPSNWELSSARATSVVKFLIDTGIPASRLVPAGFGQFHPLDPREDEVAFRRNRRIELKLTQR